MRDLALMLIIVGGTLVALRRPWIGIIMWTWVSIMNPHEGFGYAVATWPVATIVGGGTLIGFVLTRDRQWPMVGPPAWATLAFSIWICITLPFSMYYDESFPLWLRSAKIFLMLFVTLSLINDERKLKAFIWIMVFSVGFVGVKGGIFTILTGGNHRVWGLGGFMAGNNEVGLALATIIPMMRYLQLQMVKPWARRAMGLAMLLCAVTMLGTQSRGALLALAAMGFFLWLKNDKKVLWAVLMVVIATAGLSFMPDAWWDRMNTIQTYKSDESAQGRINAWWNAWNLAKDNFFGGGFMMYTYEVFAKYAPVPEDVHAAHSIYFQVLGEHGFVGLFLFMLIGALTWLTARQLIAAGRIRPELRWAADLGAMVQASMVGYGVAGAFLSLTYYDLPYNIMAIAVLALHFVRRSELARSAAGGTSALAGKSRSLHGAHG
jgi:putative inorganic carbon (hco3(-)) transporter